MSRTGQVIVALDNMPREDILNFLSKAGPRLQFIKIGLEMFCKYGPSFVNEVHSKFGQKIFLDLKLHDIPNTVAKSIHSLEGLPIDLLTIHLSGGRKMIESALQAAKQAIPQTKLLGVSYLTSLGDEDLKEMWDINPSQVEESFKRLFSLALDVDLHGIVLSSRELPWAQEVENDLSKEFIKVCPGIRFEDEIQNQVIQDQKRVETPASAFLKGANYLVMGRSLTQAENLGIRLDILDGLN